MIPLVDLHCHLLAALDDGPKTQEEALEMCRIACEEGTRLASATAHQNERWSAVTPERIREGTRRLVTALRETGLPLTVFPCAEVMVRPDIEQAWKNGELLSMADRGQYLLLEMPNDLFVDLTNSIPMFRRAGVRPILAHPERHPELLHDPGRIEELIQLGCLVQVSTGSVTDPPTRQDERAIKAWFKRGIVHFLGSDGHSPRRRQPLMSAAYARIARWAGTSVADRVGSTNGMAVLQGLPLRIAPPLPPTRRWFPAFW